MNAAADSMGTMGAGVQTWPVIGTGAVAVAPLAVDREAPSPQEPAQVPGIADTSIGHPRAGGDPATLAADAQEAKALGSRLRGNDSTDGTPRESLNAATPAVQSTTAAVAQPATFAERPSGAGMVGTTIVTLVLVIGFILLLAWLAKRMPGIGSASNPALKIVGSLPLGPRERVVVVAVGETQLLLATGPNGTRTLHTLEQPLPEPAGNPSPFAQVLAQQFGKKKS